MLQRNFLYICFISLALTACSGTINADHGRHKDNVAEFKERRVVKDNAFISSGGMRKKAEVRPGAVDTASTAAASINQNSSFTSQNLNISKKDTKDAADKTAFLEMDSRIILACNDHAIKSEIKETKVTDDMIEQSKKHDWSQLKEIEDNKGNS